jgi:hypothetical protein
MAANRENNPVKENVTVIEVTESDYELLAETLDVNVNKVKRLSKPELQSKCAEFGIAFVEDDTRAILFSKISCHIKGCE